jgi:hypothetical protein
VKEALPMNDVRMMQAQVERALAFAHAALDNSTADRVALARVHVADVLPRVAAMKPAALSLGEARELFERVSRLRAVMQVLDRKLEHRATREAN